MNKVRRYYQLARFRPRTSSENLALVVKFETQSGWSSRELRGFGYPTVAVVAAAESWLQLLKGNASLPTDPLPVQSVDRYLWDGLYSALRSPVDAILLGPLLPLQDLGRMLSYLSRGVTAGADFQKLIDDSQPFLNKEQKQRFRAWLETKDSKVRQTLLTFMWRLPESEGDTNRDRVVVSYGDGAGVTSEP